MILERPRIINEEFYAEEVTPAGIDMLLADGWRHFGRHFFRYNFGVYQNELRRVLPLRIRLADFKLSRSQRRTIRKNREMSVELTDLAITPEIHDLFHRHKRRFKSSVPTSIYDFLGFDGETPTDCRSVLVYENESLIAASFFDVGESSVSSIYGIFDPDLSDKRLGIFTLLKEIEFAHEHGKQFFYHGYAYEGESFYDYKKRFGALETFDWCGRWSAFAT